MHEGSEKSLSMFSVQLHFWMPLDTNNYFPVTGFNGFNNFAGSLSDDFQTVTNFRYRLVVSVLDSYAGSLEPVPKKRASNDLNFVFSEPRSVGEFVG